jgi:TonB family protein
MFKRSNILQSFFLFLVITLSASAKSEETLNKQFNKAYYAYQDAVKNNNTDAQFKYAKEAYELGVTFYGDTDINTANLALILAQQHLQNKQSEQSTPLLMTTLNIFKSEYGSDAIELAEIYILLGQSIDKNNKKEKAINYYLEAIEIADEHTKEHPYFNAEIQLKAGIGLLERGSRKSKAILTAQRFFTENLPSHDVRVVNANFYVGKYYAALKKYNKAIASWQANLPVFESLKGATHPLELSTHAFLIHALEKSGNSDAATKHCIAIGSMTPWNDSQEQKPLFRTQPKYPISAARRNQDGWVKIGFKISESGTVISTKVIDSKGDNTFKKSSLAAIKKWRYAPKFEDGKPVESYNTVQLDFTIK